MSDDTGFEISRDTEPGRSGISAGLSLAIEILGVELEEAMGPEAAAVGHVHLIGLGDPLAARQWLERGLGCAEGFRAMMLCAVAARDRAALDKLRSRLGRLRGERAAAGRELAEVLLYHVGDPEAAARALLAAGVSRDDLLRVTLQLAGMTAELEAELASGSDADQVAAAALAWDDGDAELELSDADADNLALLELAVEIAAASRRADREADALGRLDEALSRRDLDGAARWAVRHLRADRLAASGATDQAEALWSELGEAGEVAGLASQLALRARARSAAIGRRGEALSRSYLMMSRAAETAGFAELAAAWARRGAQLSDPGSSEAWVRLEALVPGDSEARCAVERTGFVAGVAEHVAALRSLADSAAGGGGRYLRGAAARAESLGDAELARDLIDRALAEDPKSELGQLQALWMSALGAGEDRGEVVGRWLEVAADPTAAAIAGAAAMAIAAGAPEVGGRVLASSSRAGVVALSLAGAALADQKRWAELADTWAELIDELETEKARRLVALELGRLAMSELGDLDRARLAVTAARESDATGLELAAVEASIHKAAGDPAQAAASLERGLAELAIGGPRRYRDPQRAIGLLLDLAELALDAERPAAALERVTEARKLAPRHGRTLRLWARSARAAGDDAELLAAARARLEVAGDRAEKLELATEIARLARDLEGADAARAACRRVLAIDPGAGDAVDQLIAVAEADGSWAAVDEVLASVGESPATLSGRSRALRELERFERLAEILARRLELSTADSERADLATALAVLFENQLDQPDEAVRLYREAASYGSDDPGKRSALIAVLDAQGRWADLARALRSEIDRLERADRVALSLRLAEVLRARLDRADDAAVVLEEVLAIEPDSDAALDGLESIYEQQGSDAELLGVLERRRSQIDPSGRGREPRRVETTIDPRRGETKINGGKAALLSRRIANLRAAAGDIDGALEAYAGAFAADPTDRATSGAIERLCRDHRRFGELVAHFEAVLETLDDPEQRAVWLARKGEIELRFLGNVGAAMTSLVAAVELAPHVAEHFELASSVCTRERDWGRLADLCVRRASALRGVERTSMLRRAAQIIDRRLSDPERARELDRQLLEAGDQSPAVIAEIERRAADAEDWDLLTQTLERRLDHATGGDDTIALLERIARIAEEKLVDEQRAISAYVRILEIAPSHRATLEALARISEATEEWKRFLEATERLIQLTPEGDARAMLLFKCGSVLEARFDDDERAIRYYRAAIDASVKCMPAVHGLRDLYRRRGEYERVVETLELETKLWKEPRERAGIFAQIGTIYATRLDQPRRALDYFESALAVDPDSLPANLALFEHYYNTGNWKRALPLAERMSQKAVRAGDPQTRGEFYLRRGVVLRHSGRLAMAIDSVLVALEIDPENPRALDALLDLAVAVSDLETPIPEIPDLGSVFAELSSVYRRRDGAGALCARVLIGQARLAVAGGDLATAAARVDEALALAPRERAVVEAAIAARLDRRDVAGALEALGGITESDPDELYLWALLRRAEVTADAAGDAAAACALFARAIDVDPECLEAHYRLAGEKLGLGDHAAAVAALERAIEIAAAPGRDTRPAELARYYYLLGRAREAAGDRRAATAFRRAADYDPTYPEPAIALARRALAGGDRDAAQTQLVTAAHRAMAELGKSGAVPLQRELARILAAAGDRVAASEAYRGILAVAPTFEDRIALAEVFAADDPSRGLRELEPLFAETIHYGPAYELAASYFDRLGDSARAARALEALAAVGMAGDAERQSLDMRRRQLPWSPPRRPLTARERGALISGSPDPTLDRLYRELAPMLAERFPLRYAGADLVRFEQVANPGARNARAQIDHALGGSLELLVGRGVPGGVVAVSFPQPRAVIDIELVEGPDPELRFALGWAAEVVFRRLGPLLCGPPGRREQIVTLLAELVEAADTPGARALRSHLPMAIESQLASRGPTSCAVGEWAVFAAEVPCRAGLLFSDNLRAAAAVLARLADHPVRTAPMLSAADPLSAPLVSYFLRGQHHQLHAAICRG
jgi:tetratricopeptide (TPR) repeat protein